MAGVAAVGPLLICLGLAREKLEIGLRNGHGPAERRAGYGLTIRAMADVDLIRIHLGLISDETAVAAAVDLHDFDPIYVAVLAIVRHSLTCGM